MATGNRVSLRDIQDEAKDRKGRPVAEYMFPYIRESGLSNNELAKMLGYRNHTNLSMAKSGMAILPLNKVEAMAKAVKCDKRELASLVFKTRDRESYDTLNRCSVIMNERQYQILKVIEDRVQLGDMDSEFLEALAQFSKEYAEGC